MSNGSSCNAPSTITSKGRKMARVAIVAFDYWAAVGCSWRGNRTKRDGKSVTCGHKHRSRTACEACLKLLRAERPGNCQDYRIENISGYKVVYKRIG
jgi:hypothetical protein